MTTPEAERVAETVLRLELTSGGVIEIVRTPGLPDVMIFVGRRGSGVLSIALDVAPAEARQLCEALGG